MSHVEQRVFRRNVQMIFQDPYEVYNPFYRVDHVLTTPVSKFKLAASKAAARALINEVLHAVGCTRRDPGPLPAPAERRAAPAGDGRTGAAIFPPSLRTNPCQWWTPPCAPPFLDALRTMHLEYGISIIYITHDLATAYQISDNIVVLYRGAVIEAGNVDLVVKQPRHPYTQLLISSIPLASAARTWTTGMARVPRLQPAGSAG